MFAKSMIAFAAAAASIGAVVPAAAEAQYYGGRYGYENGGYEQVRYDRHDRGRRYGRNYYRGGRNYYRGDRRCYDKGNGGLAIGAIAGGLLGNQIAGRGDRTLGTVLGAAGGGLAGRAIDRSDGRRC